MKNLNLLFFGANGFGYWFDEQRDPVGTKGDFPSIRITGFFTPAIIILLPEFFNLIKFKQLYLARKLLIYLCLSYFLFTLTQNGIIYNLVPYKTILPFYFL